MHTTRSNQDPTQASATVTARLGLPVDSLSGLDTLSAHQLHTLTKAIDTGLEQHHAALDDALNRQLPRLFRLVFKAFGLQT